MSIHRSLAAKGGSKSHRNVLSREERIAKLEDDGSWTEEESIFGLAKVRSIKPKAGKKAAKKKDAEDEAAEGAPADGEAAAEGAAAAGAAAKDDKKK